MESWLCALQPLYILTIIKLGQESGAYELGEHATPLFLAPLRHLLPLLPLLVISHTKSNAPSNTIS